MHDGHDTHDVHEAAVVAHSLPNRLRLRIPARRGDEDYFAALVDAVRGIRGVDAAKANARTGSVVVEFSCGIDALLDRLREHDLDVELQTVRHDAPATRPTSTAPIWKPVSIVTGRDINPMFMTGAALTLLGAVQALRGRVMPPSITALWYATEAFLRSGRRNRES
jgi:hypothetical protein